VPNSSENTPTLTSVVRRATAEVTGREVSGMLPMDKASRTLPGARSMNLMDARASKAMRTAQVNTTYTSPNFYTPFTQPQAFQVPTNRKEVYTWAQWIYDNEPIVAAGIDFYSDFPLAGFKIECGSPYVKGYFEKLSKKLNLISLMPQIAHHYYLHGDVILFATIDCPKCGGLGVDKKTNSNCDHEGGTISHVDILNPDYIEITPGFGNMPASYYYTPDENLIRIVREQQPREQYNMIPDALKPIILQGQPIKLASEAIWHLKHGSSAFAPYGTSILKRLMGVYAYKDKLRTAQWLIAERHILPIKMVKIGNDNRPASEEDLETMQEELANVAMDPLLTIVTHHAVDFDFVGANSKILPITNEMEQIETEFINALSLNKAIINGDGPSYSNAQVGLLALNKRLDQIRNQVAYWIEERIFRQVAMWNGFTTKGDRGEDEFIYPSIKWDDTQLRDNTGIIQVLADLFKNGKISAQTMYEYFNIDFDQEVERLRFEQAANVITPNNIAGLGSVTGMGYGGMTSPMDMSLGGPGAGLGMTPGMTPGMAPAGIGAPAGLPALASVSNPAESYRLASSIINEIFDEQEDLYSSRKNSRISTASIKSAAHQDFLSNEFRVTGRGLLGPMPDMPDQMIALIEPGPGFCKYTYPLNSYAISQYNDLLNDEKIVVAKKKYPSQPMQLFTSWEQKLYRLILEQNIPFAIYAQYQAGPNHKYQLDAAIPDVKLGIEADSRKFHSNPEDVSRDQKRDVELATQGWTILRFTEEELDNKPHEVVDVVFKAIKKLADR
jgi:very-short-patch-repair endonuclease